MGLAGSAVSRVARRAGRVPRPARAAPRGQGGGRGGGSALGGLLDAGTASPALVALLQQDASSYAWVAATVGANSAAGIQLVRRRARARDRRVQRHRPGADARAVPGSWSPGPDPLLPGRAAGGGVRWARRRHGYLVGDHQLGRADLHLDHRRRRHRVRPHRDRLERYDDGSTRPSLVGSCGADCSVYRAAASTPASRAGVRGQRARRTAVLVARSCRPRWSRSQTSGGTARHSSTVRPRARTGAGPAAVQRDHLQTRRAAGRSSPRSARSARTPRARRPPAPPPRTSACRRSGARGETSADHQRALNQSTASAAEPAPHARQRPRTGLRQAQPLAPVVRHGRSP